MTVGFIGLGIMGSAMASNLLRHDMQLIVHNRTAEKAESLIAEGAQWADGPRGVAATNPVFTMLAHPQAVEAMALGPDGFLDHLEPGTIWVDCSTVHPRFSQEMAQAAAEREVRFVDAPVAGTKPQAEGAQLVFFAGGRDQDIAACQPFFDMMGRDTVHVGRTGMGSSIKVVINSLLAASMATFAESVAVGRALGLSEEMLFNVLIGGAVTAPFLANKRDKMTTGNYATQFPLRWMGKDVQMLLEAASDNDVDTPLAAAVRNVYQAAIEDGLGALDFSAIYRAYNEDRPT